ncbi:MAG: Biopolymer transport protein ExbB, partial [Planctomycetota bacterium]
MITKQLPFTRLLSVGALLLVSSPVLAQEGGGGATEKPGFIADVFANAGVIGYIIMLMSIIAVAMIIESVATIKREKLAPPDMIDELEALFDGENFQDAVELCEQEKNYLTNVVGAGLAKLGHSFETMQVALREMQTEESVKLFQKIGWLSMMAGVGPMMGLLGTVTGMFDTFGSIAAA